MTGDHDWDALPVGEYAFPGPLRDQLVSAMGDGTKTSTSSLVVDYERDGDPLPQVGDREAVVDSQGRPVLRDGEHQRGVAPPGRRPAAARRR